MPGPFPQNDAPSSGRLVAEQARGDNAPPLSVSELSGAIRGVVEDRFGRVRVRGELSGFKRAASGHLYLCLKDENAVIDGVMWKGSAARVAFRPEDGIEVIASGRVTTFPGRSKYQIVIDSMELAGEGALMQLFERLRARLAAEGLFDRATKQPLPAMPRVIGIVTSPTGAVIRDILHRLADRFPTHVIVWPVRVQGDGAAAEVAAAVRGFDAIAPGGPVPRPDLVIVARGGGSIEDLWAFNEEVVVRAVAACRIPTISAVGHETDTTLCDHAADARAPTPTAAAEMAVPVRAERLAWVAELGLRLDRGVARDLALAQERLTAQVRLLPRRDRLYGPQQQMLDELGERLGRVARHRLDVARDRFDQRARRLRPDLLVRRVDDAARRLDALWRVAQSLDPRQLLARGWAMVLAPGGSVLTTAAAARTEPTLTLRFADGDVAVAVGDEPVRPRPASPRTGKAQGGPGQGTLF